ncbi:hypothetical protein ACFLZI_01410 [Nitrospirota bacterium]
MFDANEIINLIFALVAVLVIIFVFNKLEVPKPRSLYMGFSFILCGYVFTVIEGVLWRDFFNVIEHSCYALAGLYFLVGCWKYLRHPEDSMEG